MRKGTAVIAKGRERVAVILEAAQSVIVSGGYSCFTMRAVAAKAGISLGNLQYYFSDKAALVRGLVARVSTRSAQDHATLEDTAATGDRDQPFLALIDSMLENVRNPTVRGMLLQFWVLAYNDESIARCMEVTHSHYTKAIAVAVRKLNPDLGRSAIRRRSRVIRSMLEGAIFALSNSDGSLSPPAGLYERLRGEALRIAKRGAPRARSVPSGGAVREDA